MEYKTISILTGMNIRIVTSPPKTTTIDSIDKPMIERWNFVLLAEKEPNGVGGTSAYDAPSKNLNYAGGSSLR
jgi:hypothetical protein